jgi:predicted DCC family thiol-disulfide oxidoreductase YuxK
VPNGITQLLKAKCEEVFGTDLRSLAALRVGVSILILFDLAQRAGDLVAHYTDFGTVPRIAIIEQLVSRWYVSLHLISGVWQVQALLFIIAGLFGLAMLVGYRTTLVTIGSWIFLTSLQTRNPIVGHGGDMFLRVVLFWAMFLPWGSCYSVDSAWNLSYTKNPRNFLSWGTVAYVMQIVFVYWFTFILKSGREWWSEGSAIYYALSIDYYATSIGQFLLQFPWLMQMTTYGVLWFEALGPLLLLSPLWTGPSRSAAILGFWMLHFGILLTLALGLFPLIGIVSMLFFLPSFLWDRLAAYLDKKTRGELAIYYDQDCGFCWRSVRLMKTFLLLGEAELIPAQNDATVETEMRRHNSWVIVDAAGTRHFGFDAAPVIADASPLLWPLSAFMKLSSVRWLGNSFYRFVSLHRKNSCNINSSMAERSAPNFRLSWMSNLGIVILMVYVTVWNLTTIPNLGIRMSERGRFIGYILRLDQIWNMFAPFPAKDDGWYVMPGRLNGGRIVDVFRGGKEIDWEKPDFLSQTHKNQRWRRYMEQVRKHRSFLPYYAQYLCRDWNRRHSAGEALIELEIFYVLEWTLPNYEYSIPMKQPVLKHQCAAE